MTGKKKEIHLQVAIANQEQWDEMLATKGLTVVDVYQHWCGPCRAVVSLFRKIKNELGDDLLHFATAPADYIDSLERYRGKCEPTFLFYGGGALVAVLRGANAPLLQRKVVEELAREKKVLEQGAERRVVKDEGFLLKEEVEIPDNEQSDEDVLVPTCKSHTFAIIKPDAVAHGKANEIMMKIQEAGFEILAHEARTLTGSEARDLYQHEAEEPCFEELVQFMSSGTSHFLVVSKPEGSEDVVQAWLKFIGPADVEEARKARPESLRALYGTDALLNALHGSRDGEQAGREIALLFPGFRVTSAADQGGAGESPVEMTLALVRPDVVRESREEILVCIQEAGFSIAMQKEVTLTEEQVRQFYSHRLEEDHFPRLLLNMTSGPVLALALARTGAVQRWRSLLGSWDVAQAKQEAPESLRARFAPENSPVNQLHGSRNAEEAEREIQFFFPREQTLALIKPDALEEHKEEIMEEIWRGGFDVTQMIETVLSRDVAEEFYREHRDKTFFSQLVEFMCSGPCLILILNKLNALEEWRGMMGPTDPSRARETAPGSLRARFGRDILRNGVHGSSSLRHANDKICLIFGNAVGVGEADATLTGKVLDGEVDAEPKGVSRASTEEPVTGGVESSAGSGGHGAEVEGEAGENLQMPREEGAGLPHSEPEEADDAKEVKIGL